MGRSVLALRHVFVLCQPRGVEIRTPRVPRAPKSTLVPQECAHFHECKRHTERPTAHGPFLIWQVMSDRNKARKSWRQEDPDPKRPRLLGIHHHHFVGATLSWWPNEAIVATPLRDGL